MNNEPQKKRSLWDMLTKPNTKPDIQVIEVPGWKPDPKIMEQYQREERERLRAHFAGVCLQGLLAHNGLSPDGDPKLAVMYSVHYADALLTELFPVETK